jgi:hypothetical protein
LAICAFLPVYGRFLPTLCGYEMAIHRWSQPLNEHHPQKFRFGGRFWGFDARVRPRFGLVGAQSAARWGVAPRSWSAACGKAGGAREENRPPGWRGRRPYLSTIISVPPIATQKAVQTATTKSSVARGDQRSLL